jgi:hypothetical protein
MIPPAQYHVSTVVAILSRIVLNAGDYNMKVVLSTRVCNTGPFLDWMKC